MTETDIWINNTNVLTFFKDILYNIKCKNNYTVFDSIIIETLEKMQCGCCKDFKQRNINNMENIMWELIYVVRKSIPEHIDSFLILLHSKEILRMLFCAPANISPPKN